jgi:hypothetical protein
VKQRNIMANTCKIRTEIQMKIEEPQMQRPELPIHKFTNCKEEQKAEPTDIPN